MIQVVGQTGKTSPNIQLFVLKVEVIGGADKYQAVCRKCYGGLVDKENREREIRDETPQHALTEKLLDAGMPRKLFTGLHLWKQMDLLEMFIHNFIRNFMKCVSVSVEMCNKPVWSLLLLL